MRIVLFYFLSIFYLLGYSQNGFQDNFSDGDFVSNPTWLGDTTSFKVNANFKLQLDDVSNSSPSYLITPSSILDSTTWEFYIRLDFAPSASNYAEVFLCADSQNLNGDIKGYFLRIGGVSGSADDISLFRKDSTAGEIKIIDGTDSLAGSNPVELKIRVFRSRDAFWSIYIDRNLNGNYQLEGSIVQDSTYNSSAYFGLRTIYTSTRSDRFYFDDFIVSNTPIIDSITPTISSFEVVDSSSLKVSFSEKLEAISSLLDSNFFLINTNSYPDTVSFFGSDSSAVLLSFSQTFISGTSNQLKVSGVSDQGGNIIETDTIEFSYFFIDNSIPKDVLINEFYPDFNPSNGLPNAEFVELFNKSDKYLSLKNWTFSDASSTVLLDSLVIAPQEYIILCDKNDTLLFNSFGRVLGISSFPSLNNSSDKIEIRNESNILIDAVNYDLSWYKDDLKQGGGWSIELINPNAKCSGKLNYKASTALIGGTPASLNSVYDTIADSTPFILESSSVLGKDTIQLIFNKAIDTSSIASSQISISNGISAISISMNEDLPNNLLVAVSPALDSGLLYQLSIFLLLDCSGNNLDSNSTEFVIPGKTAFRDVVINEIYPDFSPSNGMPEAEYVELFNSSNSIINLKDWTITDGTTFTSLKSLIFFPGDYLILCNESNEVAFKKYGNTMAVNSLPTLNNEEDNLKLLNNESIIVDAINYSANWHQSPTKKSGGFSLEQINPFLNCTGDYNFNSSTANLGGTPGTQNSIFNSEIDTSTPLLESIKVFSQDSLLIEFNEGLDSISVLNADYNFDPIQSVSQVSATFPSYKEVALNLSNPLDSGEVVKLQVENLNDCSSNPFQGEAYEFALAEKSRSGDLVINELLFNPRTGGYDFVELFNNSNRILDLRNWTISNEDSSKKEILIDQPYLLFPNQFVVFTEDALNIKLEYPKSIEENLEEIVNLPSFNDDEGQIYIFNSRGVLMDKFNYTEDLHFPLLVDEEGVSLERVNPEKATNDPNNFKSAAETIGFATPGFINSQFFKTSKFEGKIVLEPETISPDNDGYQDLLSINYSFLSPSNVANVSIYNKQGRLIKSLVNNKTIENKGIFYWDGLDDNNQKASLGIYVLYFEVFDLQGNKEVFKEAFVVAGRLD